MNALLTVRDLAFGPRNRVLGHGFGLDVMPGQTWCVLGPNGSGKTSLFRTLLGLLPAHAGAVALGGEQLAELGERERAQRVAYVPQASAAAFDFTVLETVLMGRAAHLDAFASPQDGDLSAARDALDALGISHLAARCTAEVSGGERQLVLIARALTQGAPLIVMDEPAAALDIANQARVLEAITRLAEEGSAILFCSHDPNHALAAADRVLLLKGGAVLARGTPQETITAENLRLLYDTEVDLLTAPNGRQVCAMRVQR
jgi:iron complex transport system ATP-binding protein